MTLAKIGYAVAGTLVPKSSVIEGTEIVMCRDTGDGLNPADRHSTRVYSDKPPKSDVVQLGLDGSYVVGITATTTGSGRLSGIGLVLAR